MSVIVWVWRLLSFGHDFAGKMQKIKGNIIDVFKKICYNNPSGQCSIVFQYRWTRDFSVKQQITKNAIETAFLKLLRERNFEKVMVKDIVEECGLTRNTFYYYYEDTYNIIADILEREVRGILEHMKPEDSLFDSAMDAFEFLDENPKIARHIFGSVKKDELYRYVCAAVDVVVRKYIDIQAGERKVSETDKRCIANICKYTVQGMIEDWIDKGMKYSLKNEMNNMKNLFSTPVHQAIVNSR